MILDVSLRSGSVLILPNGRVRSNVLNARASRFLGRLEFSEKEQ